MKRILLAATALALLLAPAAGADTGAPDRSVKQRPQRQILVRGTVTAVSPISVRASIGAVVTCQVRNRELVAGLAVGDHVKMKCVAVDGRLVLRRLAIKPAARPVEPAPERPERVAPADRAAAPGERAPGADR